VGIQAIIIAINGEKAVVDFPYYDIKEIYLEDLIKIKKIKHPQKTSQKPRWFLFFVFCLSCLSWFKLFVGVLILFVPLNYE